MRSTGKTDGLSFLAAEPSETAGVDHVVRPRHVAARISRALAKFIPVRPLRMRNKRPLVSITFDDVPDSALLNGATILDQHGCKGTFYIAPGICDRIEPYWRVISPDGIAELSRRGHEVACHTMQHVSVQRLSDVEMAEETRACREALTGICGKPPSRNFAYPFGVASWSRKLQLAQDFASGRGTYEGLNAGWLDLMHVRAVELYDRTLTRERLERLLDQTLARNGWLVFFTHDCTDPPSWIGCSPALLDEVVKATMARNVAIVSVADAIDEISSRRTVAAATEVTGP